MLIGISALLCLASLGACAAPAAMRVGGPYGATLLAALACGFASPPLLAMHPTLGVSVIEPEALSVLLCALACLLLARGPRGAGTLLSLTLGTLVLAMAGSRLVASPGAALGPTLGLGCLGGAVAAGALRLSPRKPSSARLALVALAAAFSAISQVLVEQRVSRRAAVEESQAREDAISLAMGLRRVLMPALDAFAHMAAHWSHRPATSEQGVARPPASSPWHLAARDYARVEWLGQDLVPHSRVTAFALVPPFEPASHELAPLLARAVASGRSPALVPLGGLAPPPLLGVLARAGGGPQGGFLFGLLALDKTLDRWLAEEPGTPRWLAISGGGRTLLEHQREHRPRATCQRSAPVDLPELGLEVTVASPGIPWTEALSFLTNLPVALVLSLALPFLAAPRRRAAHAVPNGGAPLPVALQSRIARCLHDDVGQILTAVRLELEARRCELPEAQRAVLARPPALAALVDQALDSVRQLARDVRSDPPLDRPLAAAIEAHARWLAEASRHALELDLRAADLAPDPARDTLVFGIFREAMTNVARHARATRIRVALAHDARCLELEVRDDGVGCDAELHDRHCQGLAGMRERAAILHGELRMGKAPGGGTRVRLTCPTRAPAMRAGIR